MSRASRVSYYPWNLKLLHSSGSRNTADLARILATVSLIWHSITLKYPCILIQRDNLAPESVWPSPRPSSRVSIDLIPLLVQESRHEQVKPSPSFFLQSGLVTPHFTL